MEKPHERLRKAREAAGYPDAGSAADAMGVVRSTYFAHENGGRGLSRAAERYAGFFGVSLDWLLRGKGPVKPGRTAAEKPRTIDLLGYVGAGAETHFFGEQQRLGEVSAPPDATENTVAVEIRGDSLGSFFDRWLVFYDDVRRPVTADLIGALCVVGLSDGRILIKKIQRSRTKGRFHLIAQHAEPILDVEIEWAARVKNMMPH